MLKTPRHQPDSFTIPSLTISLTVNILGNFGLIRRRWWQNCGSVTFAYCRKRRFQVCKEIFCRFHHTSDIPLHYAVGNPTPQVSSIQLAWPSNTEDDGGFRNRVWENARRVFFHHLLPCPSSSCSFGVHFEGLSNSEDPSRLIKILEGIYFHSLVDGYVFPDVPDRFVVFIKWARGEVREFHVDFE